MNERVNKFLLEYKFKPGMYLRQSGIIYIAYSPFPKSKEGVQQFKKTRFKIYLPKQTIKCLPSTWHGL